MTSSAAAFTANVILTFVQTARSECSAATTTRWCSACTWGCFRFLPSLPFSACSCTPAKVLRSLRPTSDTCEQSTTLWFGSEVILSRELRRGSHSRRFEKAIRQPVDQQPQLMSGWSARKTWLWHSTVSWDLQCWIQLKQVFNAGDRKLKTFVISGKFSEVWLDLKTSEFWHED